MKIRLEPADVDDAIENWVIDRFPGWQVDGIKTIRVKENGKENGTAAEVTLIENNDE